MIPFPPLSLPRSTYASLILGIFPLSKKGGQQMCEPLQILMKRRQVFLKYFNRKIFYKYDILHHNIHVQYQYVFSVGKTDCLT